MLLPLSKSFQSLKERLQCINIAPLDTLPCEEITEEENSKFFGKPHDLTGEMSIENCLKIFDEKQQCLAEHLEKQKELDQARFEESASQ